jgi:hypothetical protein
MIGAMPSPAVLDESVVALFGQGIVVLVGTASEALAPQICRAWGPLWDARAGRLSVLVPLPAGQDSLDHLVRAPRVAFTFALPTDYRGYQLKGSFVTTREPRAGDWRRARAHFDAFLTEASRVGLEPQTFAPWFAGDGRLLVAAIDSAFCQAPGPKAGTAL